MKNKLQVKILILLCVALLLVCLIVFFVQTDRRIKELKLAQQPQAPVIYNIEMVAQSLPSKDSYQETLEFAKIFKHQIENKGVHNLFWDGAGNLINKSEAHIHEMFKLVSGKTDFVRSHEPKSGLGEPDFIFSKGDADKTILEIKLANNPNLKHLPKQVEAYLKADNTNKSVKIIVAHTEKHHKSALRTIKKLGLINDESVVLIDASNDKEMGSTRRG